MKSRFKHLVSRLLCCRSWCTVGSTGCFCTRADVPREDTVIFDIDATSIAVTNQL